MFKIIKEKINAQLTKFNCSIDKINNTGKMSRRIVRYSISFISLYTIAAMIINIKYGIEPSNVLTTSVYGFFGLELVMLMVKRLRVGENGETVCIEEEEEE